MSLRNIYNVISFAYANFYLSSHYFELNSILNLFISKFQFQKTFSIYYVDQLIFHKRIALKI